MLPLPEVIRLSLLETARLSDEKLLKRTHGDILASLEGPSDARVGRDTLVLCAEVALKVSSSYHQCPARSESTLPEVHDLFAAQPVNQKKIRVLTAASPSSLVSFMPSGWSNDDRDSDTRHLLSRVEQVLVR